MSTDVVKEVFADEVTSGDLVARDMSWLDYSERVIYQIERGDLHDLTKANAMRFIGISSHNLDEFISVRYADIEENLNISNKDKKLFKKRISSQRKAILTKYQEAFKDDDGKCINLQYKNKASKEYQKKVKNIFYEDIFPILTPIGISTNKEIPKLNENDINFFVKLKKTGKEPSTYCFIQIPNQINRLYKVENDFILVENIVEHFLKDIFNSRVISSYVLFRVIKKYNKEITHNKIESVVNRVNEVLIQREKNDIIYLEAKTYDKKSKKIATFLRKLLKVPKENVELFEYSKDLNVDIGLHYVNDKTIKKIFKVEPQVFEQKYPEELVGHDSISEYLDEDDLFLHHPYDTFDVTIQFLKESVNDSKTLSIKQTLYRVTSSKSPIISLLCEAAKKGIKVTVMLELLARFDERNNISLINVLKNAGVNIVYSLEEYKTHCKILLITKETKKGIKMYSHISTGNYNEETAKTYTDFSYFTSRTKIGRDLNHVFNMFTGFSFARELSTISISPFSLNKSIREEIDKLIATSTEESPGTVLIKVNSINDSSITTFIEHAAEVNKNITFNIICRGICTLKPADNIHIKSVVGIFLEHSRMFAFCQKGKKPHVYISSADLLTRNLFKRIEIFVPILDKSIAKRLLQIFDIYWEDTIDSWILNKDNQWNRCLLDENTINISAQSELSR